MLKRRAASAGFFSQIWDNKYGQKAKRAAKCLDNYRFQSIDDLLKVRKILGFRDLPNDIVKELDKLICSCHSPNLSRNEAGVICESSSPGPIANHKHVRFAWDAEAEWPFLKVLTDYGYSTGSSGKDKNRSRTRSIKSNHQEDLIKALIKGIDYYDPPCTKIVRLSRFDYKKHSKALQEEMIKYWKI